MTDKPKSNTLTWILVVLIALAVFFGWLGYETGNFFTVFAPAIGIMLLGVALTVWLVDHLAQKRDAQLFAYLQGQQQLMDERQVKREESLLKSQLLREVASGDQGMAARALRELDERGWLTDGSLASVHLNGANLKGAALSWANLSNTFLNRAVLESADLSYANLSAANLSDANLSKANLSLANMTEADLRGVDLGLANLNETDLSNSVADEAVFSGASMVEANLTKAQAERAVLHGTNLSRANLVESDFSYANLERANLTGANLGWANFTRANLERTDLTEANLSGTNLEDARLNGANLNGAFLFGARVSLKALSMAKSLVDATMPDGTKYEDWVRRQAGEDVPVPATPPTPPGAGANLTESPLDYRPQTA
jgi:uncharacterized protein YjbI with pentapeptide repeats